MAKVATQDQFVEDVMGIRRQVMKGDRPMNGMFPDGAVKVGEVKVHAPGAVVMDEDANRPFVPAAESKPEPHAKRGGRKAD